MLPVYLATLGHGAIEVRIIATAILAGSSVLTLLIGLYAHRFSGRKTLAIDLQGDLAGILSLAAKAKKPLGKSGFDMESVKLVAGAGFEPATFGL